MNLRREGSEEFFALANGAENVQEQCFYTLTSASAFAGTVPALAAAVAADTDAASAEEYTSHNTIRLGVEDMAKLLEKLNFGRAHHRIIYFVGKKNNITIKELLVVLQITKQSLSRVLNQLVTEGYVIVSTGDDKRTKKLSLTEKGKKLESQLSTIQINKIKKVINKFSEENINGFKEILYDMIEADNKKTFQQIND